MKKIFIWMFAIATLSGMAPTNAFGKDKKENIDYKVDRFADLEVLRYEVPGFKSLDLKEKELIYYLSQAAIEGRDILFDQNNKYNLAVRRTLEAIYTGYKGDKNTSDYKNFVVYLKRVWFSNGIHHHYAEDKFIPGFSKEFFISAVKNLNPANIPTRQGQTVEQFLYEICPVIFDSSLYSKKVFQDPKVDVISHSSENYYGNGITQREVENYYAKMKSPEDPAPPSYGLNSRLEKRDGHLFENTWKIGGLYSRAIEKIIYWLEKAKTVAENERQKRVIGLLIDYYRSGDLKTFDEYSIEWVKETSSRVDFVNGFIETYGDPLGLKASWESTVNFKNTEATGRTQTISGNAQWFEDHSPVDKRFKKKEVKGVTAKVINVAMLGGDCYPSTPIGINLPNADWIRKMYGSKSVTIQNITDAYEQAAMGNGFNEEFVFGEEEKDLIEKYGSITDNMHTDLHECLGHASGQLLPGTDPDALGINASTIEEARADLFGLYFLADPKMLELGLLDNPKAFHAEYYKYMMNGLMTQLVRIEPGKEIEEAHMRNRSLITRWVLEKGTPDKVVEIVRIDGKSYVKINDYDKLRNLFGQLLAKIQKVKSEGDFNGANELVQKYGVKVDPELHKEILERYKKLGIAPYKGFVNPRYTVIKDKTGKIRNIEISYDEAYDEQMLRYSKDYSPLPTYN